MLSRNAPFGTRLQVRVSGSLGATMPVVKLDERSFKTYEKTAAKSEDDRIEFRDSLLEGFALRVTKSGHKSWSVRVTVAGKIRRFTLPFKNFPNLADARAKARDLMVLAKSGADPSDTLRGRDGRTKAQAAALDRTFAVIAADFVARHAKVKQRSWKETERVFKVYLNPIIGGRDVLTIKRSEIVKILDDVADNRGLVIADRVLATVRKLFNWYAARDDDFRSPIVAGLAKTKPKERERKRKLTDDEIRAVWALTDQPERGANLFGALVRLLLLTGARRTEVAAITRDEIEGDVWTLPAARNKTKVDDVKPLSAAALAEIARLPNAGPYPLGRSGDAPFSGYSAAQARLSEQVRAHVLKAVKERGGDFKKINLEKWTLHDLRRTARSLMSRAGVSSDVAERVLGHTIGGVRGVYDRHEYIDEKRDAVERLSKLIAEIASPPPSNVVPLKSGVA
jgi:integrase